MAVRNSIVSKGLIFHSIKEYNMLTKLLIINLILCIRIMNRKGNSIDNAVFGNFFQFFKKKINTSKKAN